MASEASRRATYQDLLNAPEHTIAQIVDGELIVQPRPGAAHQNAASVLGEELGPPFRRGRGGPGGWIIIDEPELHLGEHVLVPDLAAWRRERMPAIEDAPYFTITPDWACEVLSPSTARIDRIRKLPIYASSRVAHAWLVDPALRTLEVFRRDGDHWLLASAYAGDTRIRAEPFDAIELDLALLWADVKRDDAP